MRDSGYINGLDNPIIVIRDIESLAIGKTIYRILFDLRVIVVPSVNFTVSWPSRPTVFTVPSGKVRVREPSLCLSSSWPLLKTMSWSPPGRVICQVFESLYRYLSSPRLRSVIFTSPL